MKSEQPKTRSARTSEAPTVLLPETPHVELLGELARQYPQLQVDSVRTLLEFVWASTQLLGVMESHFGSYGLSQGRFSLLMILLSAPEHMLSPSELAERAGVSRATITTLIDGLERAKLVKRAIDPRDARARIIRLSAKGQKFLEQMLPDHFAKVSLITAGFSQEERESFTRLLKKLEEGIGNLQERKAPEPAPQGRGRQQGKELRSVVVVPSKAKRGK